MSKVSLFGRRREIERLRFDLVIAGEKARELEKENQYLRGVRTSQAATVDTLMQELRASDELIRQLKATERKIFQMYNASEAARQDLARKARERNENPSTADAVPLPLGKGGLTRELAGTSSAPTEGRCAP